MSCRVVTAEMLDGGLGEEAVRMLILRPGEYILTDAECTQGKSNISDGKKGVSYWRMRGALTTGAVEL